MSGDCLTGEDLRRLGREPLGGSTFGRIERHVADCHRCQERLESLAGTDSSESLLTSAIAEPRPFPIPAIPGFLITSELGRGGGGVVYEAMQSPIGRRVAIKVVASAQTLDAKTRARWLREAKTLGQFRHPNVVQLHDAGECDGQLYLVLELIPGGSLKSVITGPISPRESARLIETIARAVDSLHQAGVLHLDIKPANILLDGPVGTDLASCRPILSDFGIAFNTSDRLGDGAAQEPRGTPAFMAPEQAGGLPDSVGPAADVFALGATLYALLVGRPPFQAATAAKTLDWIRHRDPVSPRALIPDLPRDLETICLVCLEKDPARRYGSAAALADDLRRWLDGHVIRARPVSRWERLLRWRRRNPTLANLAGTLITISILSFVGLTALWYQAIYQRKRAEAALGRALQGELVANEAVGELVGLLEATVEPPEPLANDRIGKSLPVVLGLTEKLRRTPEIAAAHALTISALELRLANHFARTGQPTSILPLLDDAADLLSLNTARLSEDAHVASQYANILVHRVGRRASNALLDEAVEDFRNAQRVLLPHAGNPATIDAIVMVQVAWLEYAQMLEQQHPEAAETIRRANLDAARQLQGRAPQDPPLGLLVAFAKSAGESAVAANATIAAALAKFPLGAELPEQLGLRLADLIACEFCEFTESPAGRRLDPDQIAAQIVRDLDAKAAKLRLDFELREKIIERLGQRGGLQEITARRAGRLDDARRSVAWMMALGRSGIAHSPQSVSSHVPLSRAFEHQAKILWVAPDRPAILEALRLALAEAARALSIDPESESSQQHFAGLRDKYVQLIADEPETPIAPTLAGQLPQPAE